MTTTRTKTICTDHWLDKNDVTHGDSGFSQAKPVRNEAQQYLSDNFNDLTDEGMETPTVCVHLNTSGQYRFTVYDKAAYPGTFDLSNSGELADFERCNL